MKKIIKRILNNFGFDIKRIYPELRNNLSFDDIYNLKIKKNPIIFDVGANKGQSIERFKKIFDNPIIHSFEPLDFESNFLKEKYQNDKNVIINNVAVGNIKERKDFYLTANSENSSFIKLLPNTKWLKKRSSQYNTSLEGYTKKILKVEIITLDEYCEKNNINDIDILKIDTQGYEDKVLSSCKNIFEKNIVSAVEAEIMFDNVYEKYFTFSDYEKYLIPYNFRFCAINNLNNNLFEGLVFYANLMYLNQNKINLK